jgi:2-amino-4-hydroxy-6-hydroxymethyldihydropteridine diphosphokinase
MVQRRVILGLGSNCEPRETYLRRAVEGLRAHTAISGIQTSPMYETPAMLPENAPADWDRPYLNMVIVAQTNLAPLQLLHLTQGLERTLGRVKRGHWGPREIDIDILDVEGLQSDDPRLTLPHPGMLARAFVMVPLADLLPDWVHPAEPQQCSVREVAEMLLMDPANRLHVWRPLQRGAGT